MSQAYFKTTKRGNKERFSKKDIPTCYRTKNIWTVFLDYALTAASIVGLLTALLFVIVL